MLEVTQLQAWYGRTQALFGVDLNIDRGRCLALVGTNGAGKTTTVRGILGLVNTDGSVKVNGVETQHLKTYRKVRAHGLSVVHEGRGLFTNLTVRENIQVGGGPGAKRHLDEIVETFPMLATRLDEPVSLLSGGQQQMVAIARVMAQSPEMLLLDEPGLGLAPSIVDQIYGYLGKLRERGLTILLVEQNVSRAQGFADELCLIRAGRSVMTVAADNKAEVSELMKAAFGEQ